jgi:hypothetical protein
VYVVKMIMSGRTNIDEEKRCNNTSLSLSLSLSRDHELSVCEQNTIPSMDLHLIWPVFWFFPSPRTSGLGPIVRAVGQRHAVAAATRFRWTSE